MIILGLDPGSTRIGFGLVNFEHGKFTCLAYGTIDTPGVSRADDLTYTAQELNNLIDRFKPSVAVIEKLFFTKNQKTAMAVSESRGVLLLTCALRDIDVQEVTPIQVKQAIASYGGADKKQIQRMVKLVFGLQEDVRPDDAADALALALCCNTAAS
jgi:crossover junction endodeoxyribonuclease RuvC